MMLTFHRTCRYDRRGPDAAQRQQASDTRRADLERMLADADRNSMSWDDKACSRHPFYTELHIFLGFSCGLYPLTNAVTVFLQDKGFTLRPAYWKGLTLEV